jgi:hypothetical protein
MERLGGGQVSATYASHQPTTSSAQASLISSLRAYKLGCLKSPDLEVAEMLLLATRISAVLATLAVALLGGTLKAW